MRYIILLICFFALQPILYAQTQKFSGEVYIRDEGAIVLNQVFVTNLREQHTVLCDYSGNFEITAKPGDVVRFTSIISERRDVTVTPEMLQKRNLIELRWYYYTIQEVVLPTFKVTGNLKKDLAAIKIDTKKEDIKAFIGLPQPKTKDSTALPPLASFGGGGFNLSIDALYAMISGEKKKKERLYAYEKMQESAKRVRRYFGDEFFTKQKIPARMIDNFLHFVYTSENFSTEVLEQNNPEALQPLFEKYLPVYKKRLEVSGMMELNTDKAKF